MDIILLQDVKKLGKKGELIKVNDGYARNYILPKKLGVEATNQAKNELALQKKADERKRKEELEEAKVLAEEIGKISVTVALKTGQGGKTFGSISTKEIVKATQDQLKIKLDKKKIQLQEPIKSLGTYNVKIKVHPKVVAELKVIVTSL